MAILDDETLVAGRHALAREVVAPLVGGLVGGLHL